MPTRTLLAGFVRKVWALAILMLVLVAVYVSLGRVMLPRIYQYQPQIQNYLSERLATPIRIGRITGQWQQFEPSVTLSGVLIDSLGEGQAGLAIERVVLQLDVFNSLLQWQPVFSSLTLDGVAISLLENESGGWLWSDSGGSKGFDAQAVLKLLQAQRHILLKGIRLDFKYLGGRQQQIRIPRWRFDCIAPNCSSEGKVQLRGQSQSEFNFAINSFSAPGTENFVLDAYLELEQLQLEEWWPLTGKELPVALNFSKFHMGGKLWLTWVGDEPLDIRGSIYAPEVALNPVGREVAPISNISADFVWQRYSGRAEELWTLWLDEFTFSWQGEIFAPAQQRWSISRKDGNTFVNLVADAIELGFTSNTLLAIEGLPAPLKDVLQTLKPRGQLEHAHVSYRLRSDDNKTAESARFELEANLKEVGVSPWKNAPGADGVNGYIRVTPDGGLVDFSSSSFKLFFPKHYSWPWQFDHGSGVVSWQARGKSLWFEGKDIKLKGEPGTADGLFSLQLPLDGTERRLSLVIGLQQAQVRPALSFIPDKRVAPNLVDWLDQSLVGGSVKQAGFVYSGSIEKGAPLSSKSLRLFVDAEDVEFRYQQEWPAFQELAALVSVVDRAAHVDVAGGSVFNLGVDSLAADFVPSADGGAVDVAGHLKGPAADGLKMLRDTPLREGLFDLIDDFEAGGQIALDLALHIPLADIAGTRVNVTLDTDNTRLGIPSLGLDFEKISGRFNYQTEAGLQAQRAQTLVFGKPATVDIKTTNTAGETLSGKGQSTEIRLQGVVDAASIYAWQAEPLFTRFTGETDYQAVLAFGRRDGSERGNSLHLTSDLKGIEIKLPEPYRKLADIPQPFSMTIGFDEEQWHHLQYGDMLQYALKFGESGYSQGEIRLGGEPVSDETADGIRVVGNVGMLNLDQWLALIADLDQLEERAAAQAEQEPLKPDLAETATTTGGTQQSFIGRLQTANLNVGQFKYGDQQLDGVIIEVDQVGGNWLLQVDNPVIKGQAHWLKEQNKPLDLKLEYLRLPEPAAENVDVLADVIPQQLPAFDFQMAQFSVGEDNLGSWAFRFRPQSEGALLQDIALDVKGMRIVGEMDWLYRSGADGESSDPPHRTSFRGSAKTDNIAATLKAWGYSPSIEGESGSLDGSIAWQGSPANFSVLGVKGDLDLRAKNGRLVELDSAGNALRLFGLANFSSLTRRIRLDFSDLFKKGYSYDSIRGKLAFNAGEILMNESLIIDGPSAKFKVDGRTDLVKQEFDQEVLVVLPVSDNIPIAAVIAGAPQVGLPLWLLNKAFGNMFDRFTSVRYQVKGPWSDPQVEAIKGSGRSSAVAPESQSGQPEAETNAETKEAGSGDGSNAEQPQDKPAAAKPKVIPDAPETEAGEGQNDG